MKIRMWFAGAALIASAILLVACGSQATPVPTAAPTPTVEPTTEVLPAGTPLPIGGVDVAWEHVIQPEVAVLARVNGVEIGKDAYLVELRQQIQQVTTQYSLDWNDTENQSLLAGFQDEVLQGMVNEQLEQQLATADGIAVTPAEVEAERTSAISNVVSSGMYASWDDFLTAMGWDEAGLEQRIISYLRYQKLLVAHGGPAEAEQVHAAHILVTTEETGTLVLEKLQAGADFAELAQEYSTDTGSKDQGGDLGWFPRGVMVTEFEDAAFALNPGETSGLVATDFGYHIITVLGKEVRPLDPDLVDQMRQTNFDAWFQDERDKANIETLVQFAQPSP
jgi:parvulin-like peptidyl-prolyl isomerase